MKTNKREVKKNKPSLHKDTPKGSAKKPDLKAIIERLRMLRLKKNWNQEDVAKLLGLSKTAYASIEQAQAAISVDKVVILKEVFKTSYSYIFDGILSDDQSTKHEIEKRDIEIAFLKKEVARLEESLQIYKELRAATKGKK